MVHRDCYLNGNAKCWIRKRFGHIGKNCRSKKIDEKPFLMKKTIKRLKKVKKVSNDKSIGKYGW